jgi:hypothetical protein
VRPGLMNKRLFAIESQQNGSERAFHSSQ